MSNAIVNTVVLCYSIHMSNPGGETQTTSENDPNLPQTTPAALAIPRYNGQGSLDAEPEWRIGFNITDGSITADQACAVLAQHSVPIDDPQVIVTLLMPQTDFGKKGYSPALVRERAPKPSTL